MSLRQKFTILFICLAVFPLLGIGIFDYVRSARAVQELVRREVFEIVSESARDLQEGYASTTSDLILFAENAETQQMYISHAAGNSVSSQRAIEAASTYLRQAWQELGISYKWIEFRDDDGALLYRLTEEPNVSGVGPTRETSPLPSEPLLISHPVRDEGNNAEIGAVTAALNLEAILPYDALEARFGRSGYSMVIDRSTGLILYHPRHAYLQQDVTNILESDGWNLEVFDMKEAQGTLVYRERDSLRVASYVSLSIPPWTVLSSGSTT